MKLQFLFCLSLFLAVKSYALKRPLCIELPKEPEILITFQTWPASAEQKSSLLDFEQHGCRIGGGAQGNVFKFDHHHHLSKEVQKKLGLEEGENYLLKSVVHSHYLSKMRDKAGCNFINDLIQQDFKDRFYTLERLPRSPYLMQIAYREWHLIGDDLWELSLIKEIQSSGSIITPEIRAQSLVEALHTLNDAGLIHGDLHAGNLIDAREHSVLIDFDVLYQIENQDQQDSLTDFQLTSTLLPKFTELVKLDPFKRHQIRAALQTEFLLKQWLTDEHWEKTIQNIREDILRGELKPWAFYQRG